MFGGKIFHLTAHMLPLYLVKHNAPFFTNYTAYRKKNAPSLVSQAHRPPNSPDLNSVDYRIWGLMQQRLYKTPVRDTIDLKKPRLVDTWASIAQGVVDEAVDQWTARLRARSPVRTSAPVINRFFSEPPHPHHNQLFLKLPTSSA